MALLKKPFWGTGGEGNGEGKRDLGKLDAVGGGDLLDHGGEPRHVTKQHQQRTVARALRGAAQNHEAFPEDQLHQRAGLRQVAVGQGGVQGGPAALGVRVALDVVEGLSHGFEAGAQVRQHPRRLVTQLRRHGASGLEISDRWHRCGSPGLNIEQGM